VALCFRCRSRFFFAGIAWRLYGIFRFGAKPSLAAPRSTAIVSAAARTVLARMLPRRGFHPSATLATINPYIYHVGLAIVAFGYHLSAPRFRRSLA